MLLIEITINVENVFGCQKNIFNICNMPEMTTYVDKPCCSGYFNNIATVKCGKIYILTTVGCPLNGPECKACYTSSLL